MAVLFKTGIGAFLAALGFGVLFNIHGKKLWLAGLIAGAGGLVLQATQTAGMSEYAQNFLAGMTFALLSELCARIMHTPVTTFIAAALIPFVPGGTMYYMMTAIIDGDTLQALDYFVETLTIAGILALAILISHTLAKLISYTMKKVEGEHEKV